MKNKTRVFAIVIIAILAMQGIGTVSIIGESSTYAIKEIENDNRIKAQARHSEALEVIIGTPSTIDKDDTIPVVIAGLRDAKSTYVKPQRIKVDVLYIQQGTSEVQSEEESEPIYERESWYFENQWISNNNELKIERLNDYIYKTVFPAIGGEMKLKIVVYFTWIAPWNEEFTTVESKYVETGRWRNYQQYLETNAASVQANVVDGFKNDTNFVSDLLTTVSKSIEAMFTNDEFASIANTLGVQDPSNLHFYLLNISTIVNFNNDHSYVSNLDNIVPYLEGKTEYQYYKDLLEEINTAFIDSLQLLDNRNIPYNITHVNYTYTNTNYFYTLDYVNGVPEANMMDADWDDENFEDTSLEFLIEDVYWSNHPEFYGLPLLLSFNAPVSNGAYKLSEIDAVTITDYDNVNAYYSGDTLGCINMYHDYVKLYDNYEQALNGENPLSDTYFTVDGSTEIEFTDLTPNQVYYLTIEKPGGYRKHNKAVIVNLMADLFPIMNRFYASPRSINETEYNLDIDDPNYVPPPIVWCEFPTEEDGTINEYSLLQNFIDWDNEANGYYAANLYEYVVKLGGLSSGTPFWINTVTKPFSKLVYDGKYYTFDGDKYDCVWNETNYNNYLINELSDLINHFAENVTWKNLPLFSLFDLMIHITEHGSGCVHPKLTNPNTYFRKNNIAIDIESFFNNTVLYAEENNKVCAYPNSWSFRHVNIEMAGTDVAQKLTEFQLTPFENGFDDHTPLGVMTAGKISFIQNSLKNLTAGFGYSYGLIYDIYRRAYYIIEGQLYNLISIMNNRNNTRAVFAIQGDIDALREAWDDLDLEKIDEIGTKADKYFNDDTNEYTSENGLSVRQLLIDKAEEDTNNAIALLESHEKNAVMIDNQIANTEYDVRKLGILEEVKTFLQDKVKPFIEKIKTDLSTQIAGLTNAFQGWTGSIRDKALDGITATKNKINSTITWLSSKMNTTIDQIDTAFKESATQMQWWAIGIGAAMGVGGGLLIKSAAAIGAAAQISTSIALVAVGFVFIGLGIAIAASGFSIKGAVENMGMKVTGVLKDVGKQIQTGLSNFRDMNTKITNNIIGAIETTSNKVIETIGLIGKTLTSIMEKMAQTLTLMIEQMIFTVKMIQQVLDLTQEILGKVFNTLKGVFDETREVIKKVGSFIVNIMGESFGTVKEVMSQTFGTVSEKLQATYDRLRNHNAWAKVTPLAEKIKSALDKSTILTRKTEEENEYTENMMLSTADVFTPLNEIEASNNGFYIIQVGDEFCENLYYVIIKNGSLVDPDEIDFKIRRFADLEVYGGSGKIALEAYPQIYKFKDDNGTSVNGMFYLNFTEGTKIDWYKENDTEVFVTAVAPAGKYLTLFNATIYDEETERIESATIMKTKLFTREYINDAFPVISMSGYNTNDPKPIQMVAGGDELIFDIEIRNKMWSNPKVTLDLVLVTKSDKITGLDGGSTISQLRYINVPLGPEQSTFVAAGFSAGRYTPSGDYSLLIITTEVNGDVTVVSYSVQILQENIIIDFFLKFFTTTLGFVSIGIGIAIVIISTVLYQKKKLSLPAMNILQ